VWVAAEQHAKNTEAWAQTAWNEATSFADWLAAYEVSVDVNINSARDGLDQARAALEAFYPDLVAAEKAALAVGATPADKANYEAAKQKAYSLQQTVNDMHNFLNYWNSQKVQIPLQQAKAQTLLSTARKAQAVADQARSDANAAKAVADAAEEAAKPLPQPWAGEQD